MKTENRDRTLLVTGAAGFLGSRVVREYEKSHKVFAPKHSEMELCDEASVKAYVDLVRPEIVIHCGAVSDTGWCQAHPEESRRVNVEGTEFLARACTEAGAKMIFCSSDQIYFGSRGMEAHREDEAVSPAGEYGRQKLEAEKRCLEICPDNVCLRLSWMYDRERLSEREHGNFLMSFLEALRGEGEMAYPVYDFRGITDVRLAAEKLRQTFSLPGGVYNFGSENSYSMYETVRRVLTGGGRSAERLKRNEDAFAERPRNIRMDMGKVGRFGIGFLGTVEGILECLGWGDGIAAK